MEKIIKIDYFFPEKKKIFSMLSWILHRFLEKLTVQNKVPNNLEQFPSKLPDSHQLHFLQTHTVVINPIFIALFLFCR